MKTASLLSPDLTPSTSHEGDDHRSRIDAIEALSRGSWMGDVSAMTRSLRVLERGLRERDLEDVKAAIGDLPELLATCDRHLPEGISANAVVGKLYERAREEYTSSDVTDKGDVSKEARIARAIKRAKVGEALADGITDDQRAEQLADIAQATEQFWNIDDTLGSGYAEKALGVHGALVGRLDELNAIDDSKDDRGPLRRLGKTAVLFGKRWLVDKPTEWLTEKQLNSSGRWSGGGQKAHESDEGYQ